MRKRDRGSREKDQFRLGNDRRLFSIDTFELKHPGCVDIFVFDQSSTHDSHGEGVLDAFGINIGPGGAVEPQNDTYYPPEAATKVGEPQCLWTEELVEVLINDGKVEVVKAKKVDKSKKAPKAQGKRGIAHLMNAQYRLGQG
jgi:hypothetical protein